MDKRRFLVTSGLAGLLPGYAALHPAQAAQGPAQVGPSAAAGGAQPGLLTITGAVGRPNRGPLDPVADQMMHKHGLRFEKAFALDAAALQALPSESIEPTLEYDGRRHRLDGPLLIAVLDLAGVAHDNAVELDLRAVDGYTVTVTLADVRAYRMIVALRLDGKSMALGGLGPQWAVYDADALAAFRDKPVNQRFSLCPWGLYNIDVRA